MLGVVWCVFVRVAVVVVLLVASALASMRWLLCGEKMRVQKNKPISAIVQKLNRREFISITVLLIRKQKTRNCNQSVQMVSKKVTHYFVISELLSDVVPVALRVLFMDTNY